MRTGDEYAASLRDGRTVYIDGGQVKSVPDHPAFRGVVETVSHLYDFAALPANDMTFTSPETGREALKPFMIPRSRQDLSDRSEAILRWARLSNGYLGRSPDHVASFFAGFATRPELFDSPEHAFGANVSRWYNRILDESLYLSYVIIPPQTSRWTNPEGIESEYIQVGLVEERADGIVVRGSQMLGTASAISDYVFVSCLKPLSPEDAEHALSFIVPVNAPGLKVYCRRSYAASQPSEFDYPLSTRFDETDALLVFDDVLIPWADVFVLGDPKLVQAQFFETPAHVLGNSQAIARLGVKMKFLLGLAYEAAAMNKINQYAGVIEKMAEIASIASVVEGMGIAATATAITDPSGICYPNPRFTYGLMGLQAELYPRVLHNLRELLGGAVLMLPASYHETQNEDTREDVRRYMQISHGPIDRVQLLKLAWDAIGSEFAGRHHQYEMFYAGAPAVAKSWTYLHYGIQECQQMVEQLLGSYTVPDADTESVNRASSAQEPLP